MNMFDLIDYNRDISDYAAVLEDIENDVYYDINNLLNVDVKRLYQKDKFKCRGNNIDIIYPKYTYTEYKTIVKGPDSIRFLLSLYPAPEDLKKIQSIILRPRHIEVNSNELFALYVRREKILVLYLHSSHLFNVSNYKFCGYSDLLCSNIFGTDIAKDQYLRDENKQLMQVPPLWYILSTITFSSDDTDDSIEKFVLRKNIAECGSSFRKLSDISFLYSRLGY